jgi:hypothetical protein
MKRPCLDQTQERVTMTNERSVVILSGYAGEDLKDKRNYLCKINADGEIVLSGAGEKAIGIISNFESDDGDPVGFAYSGEYPVVYGDTVVAGDDLASDADGKAVPAVEGDNVIGTAKESGSADEIHTMILGPRGVGTFPNGSSGDVLCHDGSSWKAGTLAGAKCVIPFSIALNKVANGDLVTAFVPGFAGVISKICAVINDPATTADKAATINAEIGTTNMTGGVISLTSANCTPLGSTIEGSTITGNNSFGASDSISIEASSVTAFVEGSITIYLVLTPTLSAA